MEVYTIPYYLPLLLTAVTDFVILYCFDITIAISSLLRVMIIVTRVPLARKHNKSHISSTTISYYKYYEKILSWNSISHRYYV